MPALFSIPSGCSFVDELARGLFARFGAEPLGLAGATVLLPTRRACRALREAFLRLSGGQALLLPALVPLGDLDAEALGLALEELPGLAGALDLPPALSRMRRLLLLTRVVQRLPALAGAPAQALRLAQDLARLMDQVETEGLDFGRLAGLVPADYAEHWQLTLSFLEAVTGVWPTFLAAEGAIDGARRRTLVLEAQAAAWRERPPAGPVIAAGSTGSIPATAALLQAVAALPQGMLVLPGLDLHADGACWDAISSDETHPQYGLSQLLTRLGVRRDAVQPWCPAPRGPVAARVRLIAEALRPAAVSEGWRALGAGDEYALDERALEGLTRIDCPTAEEEAGVIALLLRQALETPERTAALVTPDRTLARRVAAALERWGIQIDDSGGHALADSAAGSFLRLTVTALGEDLAPVPLLALLKHPLAAGGRAPGSFRALVRELERTVLRGARPAAGIAGLRAALAAADENRFDQPERRAALAEWLEELARLTAPFTALAAGPEAELAALVRAHLLVAEALAASDQASGAERLWRHEDGEAAAALFDDLLTAADGFPPLAAADYPGLFEALIAGQMIRPRYGLHPRLTILGPLEARLAHADLMILGGLNEGVWPAEPAPDPWMSRPMRRSFGLPAPERQIGLSAHDFAQAAAAPQVVLTRAGRIEGAPTVPSRWLLRLETVLRAAGLRQPHRARGPAMAGLGARAGSAPRRAASSPPAPRPPLAARPRRLSVTEISTWMRNPYAIYARHVLKLRPLEPLAADPGAAERGQFIHQALQAFVTACPGALPPDALERLLACGRAAFGDLLARPEVWAFWWPRFERIARWVVGCELNRRPACRPLATEAGGHLDFSAPGGGFRLVAKPTASTATPAAGWC